MVLGLVTGLIFGFAEPCDFIDLCVLDDGKERASSKCEGKFGILSRGKVAAVLSVPYHKLVAATKNFKPTNLIGEGGFERVYKGKLESGQIVALKLLNLEGLQGKQEFVVEVLLLSLLHHPNLVNLVGYCSYMAQKMMVYEYMTKGSLENHLFDITPEKEGWNTRMKIAVGAACGIDQYLYVKASPPVIYRDIKAANILLDDDFNP